MAREQKPGSPPDEPSSVTEEEALARAMSGVVPLGPDPRQKVRILPPPHRSAAVPLSDGSIPTRAAGDATPLTPGARDTGRGRSEAPVSLEDDAFARAMADVSPLAPDPRERVRVLPPAHSGRSGAQHPRSDDDAFARAMADVVPLAPDPRGRVRPTPTIPVPEAAAPVEEVDEDAPFGFVRPGVDRRELRKLKRGEYPVDDRRDLHGMTAAEASVEVERFLENSRHKRRRCVCIVHGRGLHSREQVGVLRARVRESLRANPAVLACTDAPASDGGSGAVYVLLRR